MKLTDIHIRDPFIFPCAADQCYYLFGTTAFDRIIPGKDVGFSCYRSRDLQEWEGPIPAFRPEADFPSQKKYWAPECHFYQGKYYLFATFTLNDDSRGTWILRSDSVEGPYKVWSDGPVTPKEWMSLDGTFYLAEDGTPYMIFCHEWVQIIRGTICLVELTKDLKQAACPPVTLFCADEAPWVKAIRPDGSMITDGPFIYRFGSKLKMLWSSFGTKGYAMGFAESESGRITGPWKQNPEPLFSQDGGHGMIFRTFEGENRIVLHQPNSDPLERTVFFQKEL